MNNRSPAEILHQLRGAPAGMSVPAAAAHYVGIPFAPKGADFSGCNCWGLATLVYERERRICLPRHAEAYGAELLAKEAKIEDLGRLADIIASRIAPDWREIEFGAARLYDLVLLPIAAQPCHVAIYVGNLHILHAEDGTDSLCEDLRPPRWHSRLKRARLFSYAGTA